MAFFKEQLEKNKKQFTAAGIVIAVLLIVGAVYSYQNKKDHTYYAVFLTNDQVYFGSISRWGDEYVVLKSAYYLQAQPQAGNQQVQLVKRGSELHLPSGKMKISRDQILFIEELSPDSQVSKTIEAGRN